MLDRLIVLAPATIEDDALESCRKLAQNLASATGQPVTLALDSRDLVREAASPTTLVVARFSPLADQAAPMAAAPIVYRADGRPDWSAMWTSYCELALYGGPPHRGPAETLRAGPPEALPDVLPPAIAEMRRGIAETTGLDARPAAPGWIAVTCDSPRMAAWLCATIILENVEARCDADRLLLPASATFRIEDEVKSVITVVAKTVHYWQAHVTTEAARAAP